MSTSPRLRCLLATSLVAATMFAASAGAQEGVFAGFAGTWTGPGTMTMANGDTQKITCRTSYVVAVGGATLRQVLDCASDASKLQLTAAYTYAAGAISGNWTESTRGASGQLSGQAQAGHITATVAGMGFVAGLGLSANGRQGSLTFQAQGGGDIKRVSISLRKV